MLQPLPIGPTIIQLTSEGHPPMWRLHPDTLLSTRSVPRQSVEWAASGPNNGDHTNVFLHWLTHVAKSQYTNHKKPRWYLQPRLWRRSTQLPYEDVKRAVETTRYKNDMMKQKMFIDVFSFWVVNKRDGTVSLRNCSFTGLRSPLLNSLSWRETNTFQSMGDLWICALKIRYTVVLSSGYNFMIKWNWSENSIVVTQKNVPLEWMCL